LGTSSSDPAVIGECADGECLDDEGAKIVLDGPALRLRCHRGGPPSRRCRSPIFSTPSLRTRHLRC
jgi:hypothetical protein